MSSMLDGFIKLDTSGACPLVEIDFSTINNEIDETVYKTTLVNVITMSIYVSKTKTYNVMINASTVDEKSIYFSDGFVSDMTKTFLTRDYMNALGTMNIISAPDWMRKRITTLCDTMYRQMRGKVKFSEATAYV